MNEGEAALREPPLPRTLLTLAVREPAGGDHASHHGIDALGSTLLHLGNLIGGEVLAGRHLIDASIGRGLQLRGECGRIHVVGTCNVGEGFTGKLFPELVPRDIERLGHRVQAHAWVAHPVVTTYVWRTTLWSAHANLSAGLLHSLFELVDRDVQLPGERRQILVAMLLPLTRLLPLAELVLPRPGACPRSSRLGAYHT